MVNVDDQAYRYAMGQFASGIVIVTSIYEDTPIGFTAQSFISLSLRPRLCAFSPSRTSKTWPKIRETGKFCINILASGQEDLCMQMAQSSEDKFLDVAWHEGTTNTPILDGSLCHVECKLITEHDAGDHTLAIGEVLDYQVNEHKSSPLLFFRGKVLGSLNEQVS